MTRLYVATSNPSKLRDFAVAAENPDIRIEPLPDLNDIPAPPENELTFEGNARTKAIYYSRFAPGEFVIADDSGLEVDALDGEPGVRSARYAADAGFQVHGATMDEANNLLLLRNLADVPAGQRQAQYRCVLAAVRDSELLFSGDGFVHGEILHEPRGTGGFGYDPLFYLPGLKKTMAEIDLPTKHTISHRGRALRSLLRTMSPG